MRTQKYKFRLTEKKRAELFNIVNDCTNSRQQITRAEILLEVDNLYYFSCELRPQDIIATRCGVSTTTVYKVSKKYMEEGLQSAVSRKKREKQPVTPILTTEKEAEIIALASREPPEGYKRWTLRLLEKSAREHGIAEHISDTTIGRILKKHKMSLVKVRHIIDAITI